MPQEREAERDELIDTEICVWEPRVGREAACRAFGLSPRTYRWRKQKAQERVPPRSRGLLHGPRRPHPAKLSSRERQRVLDVLCDDEFTDMVPAQVFWALLDRGVYLCSERQMYRILVEQKLSQERRRGHRRHLHEPPRVHATGPNQCWSWDITYLPLIGSTKFVYLYTILDIFSRKIVGWTVDVKEAEATGSRLIRATCRRNNITPAQLVIHSDRGAPMTAAAMVDTLEKLGVSQSLSRPRTSNDNARSEANFKTMKYRHDYPERFDGVSDARAWVEQFVHWYNYEHYHSGIAGLHPADLHAGRHQPVLTARQAVLDAVYQEHPERFFSKPPTVKQPPTEVWINQPTALTNQ